MNVAPSSSVLGISLDVDFQSFYRKALGDANAEW